MAAGLDPAIRSDPAATVNDRSAHGQEYAEREREKTMHEATSPRPVGVRGILTDR